MVTRQCDLPLTVAEFQTGYRLCSHCRPTDGHIARRARGIAQLVVDRLDEADIVLDPPISVDMLMRRHTAILVQQVQAVCNCYCHNCTSGPILHAQHFRAVRNEALAAFNMDTANVDYDLILTSRGIGMPIWSHPIFVQNDVDLDVYCARLCTHFREHVARMADRTLLFFRFGIVVSDLCGW